MARILMLLDHAYPTDIRVENEAETLSEAGFDVTILAIGPDQRPREENAETVRILRDRIPRSLRNKMRGLAGSVPLLSQYITRRMASIYRTWPFDAVHAHDLYLVDGALRGGRKLGVKVVADLHENWVAALRQYAWSTRFPGRLFVNLKRWEGLEKMWASSTDALIVVIEEMAERLAQSGVPRDLLTVVPNTVQRARFDAYGRDPSIAQSIRSACTLLYTGGMDRHRGLDTVIQAMPEILRSTPGSRLVLVGDGAVRDELVALTASLGVSASVDFRGWQPQELIPSYIAAADIGLIPHVKSEHTDHTIPHKLFHYMHLGIPVVASNCRPIERIVTETKSGLIFPSGNPADLADVVTKVAGDATLRKELGASGRRAVAETYNWETTSGRLVDLYRRLIGGD